MNTEIFKKGTEDLKISVSQNQTEQFLSYSQLLKEWNEKMNLTAVTDDDGISVKHFLDSILPLSCVDINEGASLADIGTGAGFPGIPIKIVRPDIKLTLIDSLNKRINFLNEVCNSLNLSDVRCIHGRAEELGKTSEYREKFDAVTSRAVAKMTVLCEYCLPFVKTGGIFIALKANDADEELDDARSMIGVLGGTVENVIKKELPQSDIVREIIVIRKTKPTPDKYPRRADKIKKGCSSPPLPPGS